jgi:vacuolar-type H+-ATPase subunit E/Vma4
MAIEDIFRALEEQADEEIAELLRIAKLQATTIEHEAREEADRITQARVTSADEATRIRVAKTVNAARLASRRNLAAVRDQAVDRVFGEAATKLASLRGTPEYERIFKAFAEEAIANADGEIELLVAPGDEALARQVASELGVECTVTPTLKTSGGLAVSLHAGRVMRNNTFESRLAKVRSLAQARVAEVLTS